MLINRRSFNAAVAAALTTLNLPGTANNRIEKNRAWKPNYILGTCMYGYEKLEKILPEAAKTGASAIDIWPKVHGNQREQLDEMGEEKFAELLQTYDLKLGCITQYKLGPFGLQNEIKLAKRLGCKTIVCGGRGPTGLKGHELKSAVKEFLEKMKPHLEIAEESGVTIAIENHANNLIDSPDSMKYLAEFRSNENLAIAFAPYHLPQKTDLLAGLIEDLGNSVQVFYAWQHGKGCMKKLPKDEELLQMPGRGELEFGPLLSALAKIDFDGWTEIFMHPYPRGIPIHETLDDVTVEINRARDYLTKCMPE